MREARRQRDVAVGAKRRAVAQSEFQTLLMSQVGEKPISMREILDRGRVVLERQYASDPRFLTAMLLELSANYSKLGDSEIRGKLLARAESIAVASGNREQLAEIHCQRADNERSMGEYDLARRSLSRGDSAYRAAPTPEGESACLEAIAGLDIEVGDGTQGMPAMRRVLVLLDSLGQRGTLDYAGMLAMLAGSLDRQGHHREAEVEYMRAMSLMDSAGNGETMDRAIFQHDFALTLIDLGETAKAEQLLADVLARIARSDPTAHLPSQPVIHYAQTAYFDRSVDSAEKYFGILVAQARQEHNSYWIARALFGLAQTQLMRGDLDAATRTLSQLHALGVNEKVKNTDDHIVDARILDARLALANGDSATALAHVVDVLRGRGYFDGRQKSTFREALILASEAALGSHLPDSALRFAHGARSLATLDSLTESRSAYVGEARGAEARARLAKGDTAAARSTLELALVALRGGAGAAHPLARETESLLAQLHRD
jgi:hypothetical protein